MFAPGPEQQNRFATQFHPENDPGKWHTSSSHLEILLTPKDRAYPITKLVDDDG